MSVDISESFASPRDLDYLDQLLDGVDRLGALRERRTWDTPGELHRALSPLVVQTPALDLIDRELVDLVNGDHDRLAVSMPPQEGKSERVSHAFALWLLVHNPELRIAIVSYSDEMARRHGAAIKNDAVTFNGTDGELDLGIRLREDSQAAGRWQIEGHAGGVYCVGIAGSLTGKPVDVLIIDDPVKDLAQAQSEAYRRRAVDFWRGVAVPRLGPGAKVVIVQTRFHEKDLAGHLLAEEPDRWRVVSIPAIADKQDDPLGREPGQAMVSARGERDWAAIRRSVGEYVWAALYQQRPAPAEGGLIKRAKLRTWTWVENPTLGRPAINCDGREIYLETLWKFVTADLAVSLKTSADYTAAAVWGITLDGDLILLDGVRKKLDSSQHWPTIDALRVKWDVAAVYAEAAMNATTLAYEAGRAGVPIHELKPDRDKLTRLLPAAARVDAGRVWIPPAATMPGIGDWVGEWAGFPNASHDDTVDVLAYAALVAAEHWLPMETAEQADAYRAGSDPNEIDFMTAPM